MDIAIIGTAPNANLIAGRERRLWCEVVKQAVGGCQAGYHRDLAWLTHHDSSFWEVAALLDLPADRISQRAVETFGTTKVEGQTKQRTSIVRHLSRSLSS